MKISTIKICLKVSIYLTLIIFFTAFYFIGQLQNFTKGGTTFGTRIEKLNEFFIPDTAICFDPGFKKDVIDKYKYPSLSTILYDDYGNPSVFNESMWNVFNELTYNLNRDFNLTLEFHGKDVSLKYGKNQKDEYNIGQVSHFHLVDARWR